MGRLLKAELIKLRTTRTFIALIAVAAVLSLAVVILQAAFIDATASTAADEVFNADTSSLFILILAVVGISGEWRHRTITSSLLAAPDRWRFLFAKVIAYAVAGVVLSLAISVLTAAAGSLVLSIRDQPGAPVGDLVELGWHNLVIAAIFGGLGVGLGGLIRNQPTAIVGILVVSFIAEPLLLTVASSVGRFGPFTALPVAFTGASAGFSEDELFSAGTALALMLAWAGLLVAAAGLLLQKRDLDG